MKLGFRVYAFAAIVLGLIGLIWDDFAGDWQPVPGDLPGRPALAYIVAIALTAFGTAIQFERFRLRAAACLALLYFTGAALLHGPEVYTYPTYVSAWSSLAEQLVLVAGGVIVVASSTSNNAQADTPASLAARMLFSICLVVFGLAHFVYLSFTASMVPSWVPPNQTFWACLTGAAHISAGAAILSGRLDLLAARLVTGMFIGFGLLVHAPGLVGDPRNHDNWVANAINLALVGSAWVVADAIGKCRAKPTSFQRSEVKGAASLSNCDPL